MHTSTIFFFLGIATGTLAAIIIFGLMILSAFTIVDFIALR